MAFKMKYNTDTFPFKQTDLDTTWADQIYTKEKVDEYLRGKGHHTEGELRGKVDTDPGVNVKAGSGGRSRLGSHEMTD